MIRELLENGHVIVDGVEHGFYMDAKTRAEQMTDENHQFIGLTVFCVFTKKDVKKFTWPECKRQLLENIRDSAEDGINDELAVRGW